jgi:hypothetical protein
MKSNDDWQAWLIKFAAVLTAMPRWVAALLAAEGFALPQAWIPWWIVVSAVMSAGMAVVEGLAFAYVFSAWRNQTDAKADNLLRLAALSAVIFILVLAPYIAASVQHVTLGAVLAWKPALYVWSAAVAASTITIVVSVGYAQKAAKDRKPTKDAQPAPLVTVHLAEDLPALTSGYDCEHVDCGRSFASQQALAAHMRVHQRNGHTKEKVSV